jgi:hypothetical protein
MTVYTSNKPDAGPSPLLDAPIIQANFATFNTVFSNTVGSNVYDHTALNSPLQGHHESIVMNNQAQAPGVAQNLCVLFNMNATNAAGTQPQLWAQITRFLPTGFDTTNPGNPPMLLTYNAVNTSGPIYQSFLPGGYIFYIGTATFGSLNITVTPTCTKLLIAVATAQNTYSIGGSFRAVAIATTITGTNTFTIFPDTHASAGNTYLWYAIGVA